MELLIQNCLILFSFSTPQYKVKRKNKKILNDKHILETRLLIIMYHSPDIYYHKWSSTSQFVS